MRIPSGVTDQYIYFVAVDATDLSTRETGLSSFTVYRSRNGGAAAAMSTPTINETSSANMPGVYELLLDEDMTLDAGDESQEICFHITHAGMAPVTRVIEIYRGIYTDAQAEPSGVPAANETLAEKIGYLFMALRNKVTVTASKKTFYDDGDAAEWEKDLSDDGTTYTESEGNSP